MLKIKDNTVIKKMMLMSVTVLVTGVLLFAGFAKPALAWPPPPCSGCCDWNGSDCIPNDLNCEYGGEGCESCVDCNCVDDDSKCDYICCNGSCCSEGQNCCNDNCCSNVCCNGVCCSEGQICCNGTCCDSDDCCNNDTCCDSDDICCTDNGNYCCELYEHCGGGECVCDNCYEWDDVFSNYPSSCPDCNNAQGGCYSSYYWIQEEFSYFTGDTPPDGEMGLCDNPTKVMIVGYHIFCTDYDTDVDAIIEIVINLGLDLSTYVDCGICVVNKFPSACYKCIIGLIVGEIIDDLPCLWVDGCEHCYDWDENCSSPIEIEVVDWEADNKFCYPGITWP